MRLFRDFPESYLVESLRLCRNLISPVMFRAKISCRIESAVTTHLKCMWSYLCAIFYGNSGVTFANQFQLFKTKKIAETKTIM